MAKFRHVSDKTYVVDVPDNDAARINILSRSARWERLATATPNRAPTSPANDGGDPLTMSGAADEVNKADETPDATVLAVEEAEHYGIDLTSLAGTGAGGRITVEDVRAAAKAQEKDD